MELWLKLAHGQFDEIQIQYNKRLHSNVILCYIKIMFFYMNLINSQGMPTSLSPNPLNLIYSNLITHIKQKVKWASHSLSKWQWKCNKKASYFKCFPAWSWCSVCYYNCSSTKLSTKIFSNSNWFKLQPSSILMKIQKHWKLNQ